ncbi:MAG: methyltransferase domain-containing protein [Promethearchaeota archaeon]|jgi:SAM-dependent methyltransferase
MLEEEVRNLIPMAVRWVYNVDFPAAKISLYKFIKTKFNDLRIKNVLPDDQLFSICKDTTDKISIGFLKIRLEERDLKTQFLTGLEILYQDLNELLKEAIEYINENPDHIPFIMKDWRRENSTLIRKFNVYIGKGLGNLIYKSKKGNLIREIHRTVFGDDYPEEADPDGYITMNDLLKAIKFLDIGPGKTFIDIGCGRGGPGMWIARETRANYLGLDPCEVAIEKARERVKDFGLKRQVRFQIGNIISTDFPDNQFDGAISIDAIQLIQDPQLILTAINEIYRILRKNSRLVIINGEVHYPNHVSDYRPLFNKAGFEVESYNEVPDWKRRRRLVLQKILESRDELIQDMGKLGASFKFNEAQSDLSVLNRIRRIIAVAKKI